MEELEKLRQKVEKFPKSTLFVQLAEEFRKLGRLDDAIETLRQGIERQPGYMSARISLGRVYMDKKMLTEAAAEFEKVVQAVPDNLLAHRQLADIYMSTRDEDRAIEQLLKVLELNPMDEKAEAMLSKIHSGGLDEASEPPADEGPADEVAIMELEEEALLEEDAELLSEEAQSGDLDEGYVSEPDSDELGYEAGEVEIEPDGLYEDEDASDYAQEEDSGGLDIPDEEGGEPSSLQSAAADLANLYRGKGSDLDTEDEHVGEVHVSDEDMEGESDLARAAEEVGREVLNEPFDDDDVTEVDASSLEGLEATAYDRVEDDVPTAQELEKSALELEVPEEMAEPVTDLETSALDLEVADTEQVEGLEHTTYDADGDVTYEAMPEAMDAEEAAGPLDEPMEAEQLSDEPVVAESDDIFITAEDVETAEAEPAEALEAAEEAVIAEAADEPLVAEEPLVAKEQPRKASFAELIKPVMESDAAEEAEEVEAVEVAGEAGVPVGQLEIANRLIDSGEYLKAMNVYSALLSDSPDDEMLKQKVQELKMLMNLMGLDKELYAVKLKAYLGAITRRRDEFFERT